MRVFVRSLMLILLLDSVAIAQLGTGSVDGLVTDAPGAVIPGATVSLKNLNTGAVVKTTSDGRGFYSFRALQPGEHELTFELEGFKSTRVTVRISSGVGLRENVTLQVGEVSETITVSAAPVTLSTSSAMMVSSAAVSPGFAGPPPNFHTEEYGVIDEPGFAAVANKPLSTFSIDVDTASYANMRRFLHDGELPPSDAVRIEELINYFDYDYPEPAQGEPFIIVTEMVGCPWAPSHRLVHIGLRSKPVATANLPPNNLVFLLDVSGSMESADKLPLLKKAFFLLAQQLRPEGQISIVVYAGAAGMILSPISGA